MKEVYAFYGRFGHKTSSLDRILTSINKEKHKTPTKAEELEVERGLVGEDLDLGDLDEDQLMALKMI
jgi:hypothetical protein